MKVKLTLAAFALVLLSINVFSQERKFEIALSLEKPELFTFKPTPVKIKITNLSENTVDIRNDMLVTLVISRLPQEKESATVGRERFDAIVPIPKALALLPLNEFAEFEVTLNDLYWMDSTQSTMDFKRRPNFRAVPPRKNYFYASIRLPEEMDKQGTPLSSAFFSNQFVVSIDRVNF